MTKEERIEILQKQLDMTNVNYNKLNKKYIELNLKTRHLQDGIEIIKHREYSDISGLVEENSVLKKKNREQDEKIKELESELNFRNHIIWDENNSAILCGDCYCTNNDVRKLIEKNLLLKEKIKELEESIKMLNGIKRYDIGDLLTENIKLKQSQNSKAIEEIEKLETFMLSEASNSDEISYAEWVCENYIEDLLTKLRGSK